MNIKPVNLLPRAYKETRKRKRKMRLAIGLIVIEIVGYVFLTIILPNREVEKMNRQLDKLSNQLLDEHYMDVNQKVMKLKEEKNDLESWKQCYEQICCTNFISSGLIESLLAHVPKGVSVEKLNIVAENDDEEKAIGIEGIAEDSNGIVNYQMDVEERFGFHQVNCLFEWDEEKEKYGFTMEIRMDELESGQEEMELGEEQIDES